MILAQILGNLGRDAEVKNINGKEYISFSVASTEKQGEQEATTWVSVLASHNPNLLQYLKKGQQVFVSGRMKASIYQSNNSFGIDLSVFAQALQLCGGKRDEQATVPAVSPAGQSNGISGTTAIAQPGSNGLNTGQTVAPPMDASPFPPLEEKDPNDLPF